MSDIDTYFDLSGLTTIAEFIYSYPIIFTFVISLFISSVTFTSCFFCRKVASYEAKRKNLLNPLIDLSSLSEQTDIPVNNHINDIISPNIARSLWGSDTPIISNNETLIPNSILQLTSTKFIHKLEPELFQDLYSKLEWIHLKDNEIFFRKGELVEEAMYIIIEGKLGLYMYNNEDDETLNSPSFGNEDDMELVCSYKNGDSFGEFSLLLDEKTYHTFDIKALCSTTLIKISRSLYEEFVTGKPNIFLSFVKTALASKWRTADYLLNNFFEIPKIYSNCVLTSNNVDNRTYRISSTSNNLQLVNMNGEPVNPVNFEAGRRPPLLSFPNVKSSHSNEPIQSPKALKTKPDTNRIFLDVNDDLFKDILKDAEIVSLMPGEVLYKFGAQSLGKFYLCLKGKLVAYNEDNSKTWYIQEGEVLGATSLLTNGLHDHTIKVLSPCQVIVVNESKLESEAHYIPIVLGVVKQLYGVVKTYYNCGLQIETQTTGQNLFRKGQPVLGMYVVCSGRLRIDSKSNTSNGSHASRLMEVGRGQCVGETAILANEANHSYTLVCVRDSELVKISKASLSLLCNWFPTVLKKLSSIMAQRLKLYDSRGNLNSRFSNISTIAIVPISNVVRTREFATNLQASLSGHGKSMLITEETMKAVCSNSQTYGRAFEKYINEQLKNKDGVSATKKSVNSASDNYLDQVKMQSWICEQEEINRYLLFEATFDLSSWSKICVKQADLILLVGSSSDENGRVNLIEHALLERCPLSRVELVILHEETEAFPINTARFLDCRPSLDMFHHIRNNNLNDHNRLGRYFSSKSVGVVLSGGGARGLAHLGVLKALEDANIPIDFIGGTSQGSLMAAFYAKFLSTKAMEPDCRISANNMSSLKDMLLDLTPPIMSLFSGKSMNTALHSYFGDMCIEDLWLPYFTVTTNISYADVQIHKRGLLWQAIRASMSILHYFPPVRMDNGDIIIDGGYCNNLPCDIMRDLFCPNVLVGVDIENKSYEALYKDITDYGPYLSGWWIIRHYLYTWINPFAKPIKLPRYGEIVACLNYINNSRNIRQLLDSRSIDIYIHPELGTATLLDYHKFDEIVSNGYHSSKAQITAWKINNPTNLTNLTRRHSFVSGKNNKKPAFGNFRSNSYTNLNMANE